MILTENNNRIFTTDCLLYVFCCDCLGSQSMRSIRVIKIPV